MLEREKYLALNKAGQNYDSLMVINHDTIDRELDWWLENILQGNNNILYDSF